MQLACALNPNINDDATNGCIKPIDQTIGNDRDDTKNDIKDGVDVSSVMLNISNRIDMYQSLECIVYSFDRVITYWTLYDALHGDMSHLYSMKEIDFLTIFGSRGRIRRLTQHFESIISRGIKLILLFVNRFCV